MALLVNVSVAFNDIWRTGKDIFFWHKEQLPSTRIIISLSDLSSTTHVKHFCTIPTPI